MPGRRWSSRTIRLGLVGIAAMKLAVPRNLLAQGTTGHDWYAAGKFTAVEIALAVGFSEHTAVACRRKHGSTGNMICVVFVEFDPPVLTRQRILSAVGHGVMMGVDIGGTGFCLQLLGSASNAAPDGAPAEAREKAPGGEGSDEARENAIEDDGPATGLSGTDPVARHRSDSWRRGTGLAAPSGVRGRDRRNPGRNGQSGGGRGRG
ncbi:MAG: hypothetical protein OXI83_11565 [Gemmatimonadota bacterium]|nr:hypothetical protein [Gemmatimonadota bacterium]